MSFADKAKPLTELGIHVLPAHPNKSRSFLKDWVNKASRDPRQIAYWGRTFPDANVVVACGKLSDVCVIDVDVKNGVDGNVALVEHKKKGNVLPPRPMVRSPSGGLHLYFKYQPGLTNAQGLSRSGRGLGDGIDFRTQGGSVCGAGSSKENGPYTWIGKAPTSPDDFPYLPMWAIKALRIKPSAFRETPKELEGNFTGVYRAVAAARESRRNGVVFWAANRMREEGAKRDDWITLKHICLGISGKENPEEFWHQCLNSIRSALRDPSFTI